MLKIGCHLSSSAGFKAMGEDALSIGANVFQFFTRNPRGGSAKPFDKADAAALVDLMRENGFGPALAHAPYTLPAGGVEDPVADIDHVQQPPELLFAQFDLHALTPFSSIAIPRCLNLPLR